jgi:hypothetical protein
VRKNIKKKSVLVSFWQRCLRFIGVFTSLWVQFNVKLKLTPKYMKKTITVALAGLLSASSAYSATTFSFTDIRATDEGGGPMVGSDAGAGTVTPIFDANSQTSTGNTVVFTANDYALFNTATEYDIEVTFTITGASLGTNNGVYKLESSGSNVKYSAASIKIFDSTGLVDLTDSFDTSFVGYNNIQLSGVASNGSDTGTVNGDSIAASASQIPLSNVQTIDVVRTGGKFNVNDVNGSFTISTVAVPEPSSTALLGLGGLALILRRRK